MIRATTIFVCLAGSALAQDASVLILKTRIPLPNVDGRMDHLSVDVKGQRLFVSALGNNTVEVLDLQSGQRVRTLPGLAEPQGLFYDDAAHRLYAANGVDGATKVFDGATFQLVDTVKFSDDADNIRYDARSRGVVVGYGGEKALRGRPQGTGALGILDSGGKLIREIVVDAHPESFQLEKSGTRVFVNVPDKQEVQVADFIKGTILARWPITTAKTCFPMALDEAHHRLFIGCRMAARLLAIDTESGKLVDSVEIVPDTDDLFYDAALERIYVIGGGGFVDVIQQKDPDHYQRIEQIQTAPGARTGLFVPERKQLFVAVPHRGAQPAAVRVYEARGAK